MQSPFLTGMALGAFLVAALAIWWYHFGGAAWLDAKKAQLEAKLHDVFFK